MNNILDYVKPLVDKIYRREPDYDNDIVVQPNEILIKETGRFSRVYVITLTENGLFNIVISYDNGIMDFERETIDQVVDFVLE
jgi:hypothetical protein